MKERRFDVVNITRVHENVARPFLGRLTNYDIYNARFKSDAVLQPFDVPESIIEHIFYLVSQRYKHDTDGVFVADIWLFEDAEQVGGCKVDLFIEDNRVMGVNYDYCYPKRKSKVAADE